MILSVSSNGKQWSFDLEPDSFTLTVKNLVQKMKINSQENPLTACSLLLSERLDSWNNHLAQVPSTTNQKRLMEIRDKVLPSVGSQQMDRRGYQVSDMDELEFYRERDQMDADALFRPCIENLFFLPLLNDFEMGSMTEKPSLIEEEQNRVNTSLPPTTPVYKRTTRPQYWWKVAPLEKELILFEKSPRWKKNW